ncbi:hypothetical protein H4219_006371 [Mycoemilia scoparia]|uniref:Gag protein n=1 Tax=Mycoemilia scoparia TaxID=417184 RepID=A0A9W8DHP2_9FUNG|nr:hypothetical protein H4219_006371 [Mycoemilia scoparia]
MGRPRKIQDHVEDPHTADDNDVDVATSENEIAESSDNEITAKANSKGWTHDYNLLLPFDDTNPLSTDKWLSMVESLAKKYGREDQLLEIGLIKLIDKAKANISEMGIPEDWEDFKSILRKHFDPNKELKRIQNSIINKSRYGDMNPTTAVQRATSDQHLFERKHESQVMDNLIILALGATFKPEVWMAMNITIDDTFEDAMMKIEGKISAAQLMDNLTINAWVNGATVQAYNTQIQQPTTNKDQIRTVDTTTHPNGKKPFRKFQKGNGKGFHVRISDLETKQTEILKGINDLLAAKQSFQ